MALTYFYADIFGLMFLVVSLALLANRRQMLEVVREILAMRAILFIAAIASLFLGLLVVLTHNIWDAGTLASVVTLVGWVFVIRGALLLFLPHATLQKIFHVVSFEQIYYSMSILVFVVGLYLTYNGFFF